MGVPFEDVAPSVAATVIVITTFALIVFPLRVWVRWSHKAWGWDDWSMTVAAVRLSNCRNRMSHADAFIYRSLTLCSPYFVSEVHSKALVCTRAK